MLGTTMPMRTPFAPLLRPITAPLEAIGRVGETAVVVGRTGILGPYPPHRLLAAGAVLRRNGVGLGGVFALAAALRGDHVVAVDDRGASTATDMERRAAQVAAALAAAGVRAGDQVAVMCRNSRHFLATIVALGKIGADILYLNTGFAAPQLREVSAREGAKAMVLDEEFLPVAEGVDLPLFVAWRDGGGRRADGVVSLDDVVCGPPLEPPAHAGRESRQIILTSGTTGTPKGAQRETSSQVAPIVALLSRIPLRTGDVTVVAAPMFHSWGLANAAIGLAFGSRLVLPRRFDPEDTLRLVAEQRASVLVVVPVMLQRIMDLPEKVRRRYDTSSLRVIGLSGSALPGELAVRAMDAFGDVVYNLYGSTEVGWVSIADPADLRGAPGTAGRVPLGTSVRLLDDDDAPVAPGRPGRIFVRSGLLFEGYTGGGGKAVVDGYMSTGDMGHFDEAGRLFVDGRDDDMIVSGGENVFPREVEDLLAEHPSVADVAVVGVPDEEFGQRLAAFVVAADGAEIDPDELRGHVRAALARYKVPRDITVVDELPRNATGKVLRRELRDNPA
ncbi:MAG TPA: AMP-binding protein [Acidimicrobiales bacterium]|nr:AMP-binding protein [Acidimicrobiales bacterium]